MQTGKYNLFIRFIGLLLRWSLSAMEILCQSHRLKRSMWSLWHLLVQVFLHIRLIQLVVFSLNTLRNKKHLSNKNIFKINVFNPTISCFFEGLRNMTCQFTWETGISLDNCRSKLLNTLITLTKKKWKQLNVDKVSSSFSVTPSRRNYKLIFMVELSRNHLFSAITVSHVFRKSLKQWKNNFTDQESLYFPKAILTRVFFLL